MHNTASYLSFIQTLQNNKSWILKFPVCSLGHNPLQLQSNDIVKHMTCIIAKHFLRNCCYFYRKLTRFV